MKREPFPFQLQRYAFILALVAMLAAMVCSVLKRTHVAEQAGIVVYIFLVIGVVAAFVGETRTEQSDEGNGVARKSNKTRLRKRSV